MHLEGATRFLAEQLCGPWMPFYKTDFIGKEEEVWWEGDEFSLSKVLEVFGFERGC